MTLLLRRVEEGHTDSGRGCDGQIKQERDFHSLIFGIYRYRQIYKLEYFTTTKNIFSNINIFGQGRLGIQPSPQSLPPGPTKQNRLNDNAFLALKMGCARHMTSKFRTTKQKAGIQSRIPEFLKKDLAIFSRNVHMEYICFTV